jgi:hypothetical protein
VQRFNCSLLVDATITDHYDHNDPQGLSYYPVRVITGTLLPPGPGGALGPGVTRDSLRTSHSDCTAAAAAAVVAPRAPGTSGFKSLVVAGRNSIQDPRQALFDSESSSVTE